MVRTAVLLVLCATAAPAAAVNDRQSRTLPLTGRTLSVEVTIGQVRIEGTDRPDAEIQIDRRAPTVEALAELPVVVDESPDRVAIRVVQAHGATDPAFRSDVVLRVPADASVDRVRVMEGGVAVERFRGTLTADVRRGPIDGADVAGTLRLETGIGSVTLKNARLSENGLLRLRAFNGDVRLQLAGAPADARILALALNGSIQSDIPMTTRDTWGPRWSEATLGKGEPVISIDVVTGKIDIRTR
jgi:DUF4097 and DUF4098 domain-containing protein YvlB